MSIRPVPINSDTSGFTLIEVMIVVFIIGLLAALVMPRMFHRGDEARVTAAELQIRNFETALRMFRSDNGFYPSTDQGLNALVSPPSGGMIPDHFRQGGYLGKREVPVDPWGNNYAYLSPGTAGEYEIISYGADGRPGGDGVDADISNTNID